MEKTQIRSTRLGFLIDLAYWAAILAVGCGVLKLLSLVLPLLLALALAALVRPLARFLSRETRYVRGPGGERVLQRRKFHLNRTLAGVGSVLALFALLGGLVALLLIRAANALTSLLAALPEFYTLRLAPGLSGLYEELLRHSRRLDPAAARWIGELLPQLETSLGRAVTDASGQILGSMTALAARLPGLLLSTAVTMIAAVFIALDYDRIRGFFRKNLPARPLHLLMTVRNSFADMMRRFLRSYLLLMLLTAGENALGLWLIGVKRPLSLGLLIGVVDIFPVVGSGTVLLPWALVEVLIGESSRGGALALLYLIVTVARQLLEPRIVGERVGLRPIVTLGCMVVGGRLFGPVGLFALPVMAAILTDLNRSGVIQLFQHSASPPEGEAIIHSEGIEA